ncbi:hypothetical protein NDU88_004095 [Pleurodeles waltl]|uniref:Uncharacterized protein n=1 Tax=Pleurodeles waltl TaxID=8319 RepID=A0AAV7NK28_PLEWA|nr:hypothetical protein NDU88_004095 [Pleurodeles waltl]
MGSQELPQLLPQLSLCTNNPCRRYESRQRLLCPVSATHATRTRRGTDCEPQTPGWAGLIRLTATRQPCCSILPQALIYCL